MPARVTPTTPTGNKTTARWLWHPSHGHKSKTQSEQERERLQLPTDIARHRRDPKIQEAQYYQGPFIDPEVA